MYTPKVSQNGTLFYGNTKVHCSSVIIMMVTKGRAISGDLETGACVDLHMYIKSGSFQSQIQLVII